MTGIGCVCFFGDFNQKYYHGESIAINVLVDNNTSKSVKKIKISGELTVVSWTCNIYFSA